MMRAAGGMPEADMRGFAHGGFEMRVIRDERGGEDVYRGEEGVWLMGTQV